MRVLRGLFNRSLQIVARFSPGATTVRVWLHRLRGVHVGPGTFIGTDALIETSKPHLVYVGSRVAIGIRTVIIAHFRGPEPSAPAGERRYTVRIEDEVFIGPGVIILPNVTIGRGSVVNAGSVVTRSVPPMTVVQGNPAVEVARCAIPLGLDTPLREFQRSLKPIAAPDTGQRENS